MTMSPLLEDGLMVTLIGMGTVFVLLTALIGLVHLMSRVSRLLEGPAPAAAPGAGSRAIDPKVLSAIGAAVRRYRDERRGP